MNPHHSSEGGYIRMWVSSTRQNQEPLSMRYTIQRGHKNLSLEQGYIQDFRNLQRGCQVSIPHLTYFPKLRLIWLSIGVLGSISTLWARHLPSKTSDASHWVMYHSLPDWLKNRQCFHISKVIYRIAQTNFLESIVTFSWDKLFNGSQYDPSPLC